MAIVPARRGCHDGRTAGGSVERVRPPRCGAAAVEGALPRPASGAVGGADGDARVVNAGSSSSRTSSRSPRRARPRFVPARGLDPARPRSPTAPNSSGAGSSPARSRVAADGPGRRTERQCTERDRRVAPARSPSVTRASIGHLPRARLARTWGCWRRSAFLGPSLPRRRSRLAASTEEDPAPALRSRAPTAPPSWVPFPKLGQGSPVAGAVIRGGSRGQRAPGAAGGAVRAVRAVRQSAPAPGQPAPPATRGTVREDGPWVGPAPSPARADRRVVAGFCRT
jgi:hypothetical protein